jgi:PUA domain protein
MDVKSRHHLRSDAVGDIRDALAARLGVEFEADTVEKVELEGDGPDVVLVDGDPLVFYVGDDPFVTVAGANRLEPTRGVVTVDAGAISFVSDGADVMRPGVVDADDDVAEGDLVVVNEESHGKFLAVGRALTDGADMVGESGRVVESLHHVGDDLYEFTA